VLAAGVAAALALALVPACKDLAPEVGDRLTACNNGDSNPNPTATINFKAQIRPLMDGVGAKGCKNCHYYSVGTREGLDATGLNLETLGALRKGGRNTGANIFVAGQPCNSAIVQKLRGTFGSTRMPKDGPYWTPEQIQLVIDWIAEGAKGADNE